MVRLARIVVPGYPHHVTQRGNRRQVTFFCDVGIKPVIYSSPNASRSARSFFREVVFLFKMS